jgi:2-oxoisovalerate dehydrogenase E1 component
MTLLDRPPRVEPSLTTLFSKAFLIRAFEERLLRLFAEGKLFGTVHTCIGQELTGIALAESLRDGDNVCSTHRCHGHFIARTGDVDGLLAEIMGRTTGVCGGRGGSQHVYAKGFFSNGVQGGMLPVAGGLAFAQKHVGARSITVAFIGDGTLGEGVLYEVLNVVSKWELPLLVIVENNLYAQSTHHEQTLAGDIGTRAAAFGLFNARTSVWDPTDLRRTIDRAVAHVREERRPALLEVDAYRLMAHSKGDDDRDRAEVEAYWARDPLSLFGQEKKKLARRLRSQAERRIDQAVSRAEAAPYSAKMQAETGWSRIAAVSWSPTSAEGGHRVVDCIHAGLQRNMEKDERIILIGEDIEGPYGGAFKVSRNLSLEFPGRVRNTPISEAAIVGLGNGLALAGMRPVCEIMFGDFLTLAADQIINHASKFRYMYNEQVTVPLIVRTPMGGRRGYGATHSQSLEKHFMGLPGTLMLAIHHRYDPGDIYDRLFATVSGPTIVIENKVLYAARVGGDVPAGFVLEHSDETFPTTRLRPLGKADITIVCYGGVLTEVEKAVDQLFEEHEIIAEVVCPVQICPFNLGPILESVQSSGRLLVVEEGQSFAGFGAEVIAQVVERMPRALVRAQRLGPPSHPIPSCGPLEKALLPGAPHIVQAVVATLAA